MNTALAPSDLFRRDRPALLVVISGASGVGKDAVVRNMKKRGYPFHFVVTATDRPPRPEEVAGVDYFFYTTAQFEHMIAAGELLEHARVYSQYKGVPKESIWQALTSGVDAIMRVDVQGARTVKGLIPAAVTIFLSCESEQELIMRLRQRRTDSEEQLQRRLATAREEMSHMPEFDYVVINPHDSPDDAVDDIGAIMRAEHCRSRREAITL